MTFYGLWFGLECDVGRELTYQSLSVSSTPFTPTPPPPAISGEAVFARCLSSLKDERVEASRSLSGPQGVVFSGDKAAFLEAIRKVDDATQYTTTRWCVGYNTPPELSYSSQNSQCTSYLSCFKISFCLFFITVTCIHLNCCHFSVCRPSMPPRSFPTHRASCCCGRQPKSSAGPSTMAASPWCGEEAASSEGTLWSHGLSFQTVASTSPCATLCQQAGFTPVEKIAVGSCKKT